MPVPHHLTSVTIVINLQLQFQNDLDGMVTPITISTRKSELVLTTVQS